MTTPDWDRVRAFHGHLGPYVALGLRIGERLLALLQPRPHFGLHVAVVCPLAPPPSCLLDGLQLATGATYGKQNLLATAGEAIVVTARNLDTGATTEVTVPSTTRDQLATWMADLGGDGAALRVWETPDDGLFEVRCGGADG